MKFRNYFKLLLSVFIVVTQVVIFTGTAQATIFKCDNTEGATFYNDKPCPKIDVETKLKAVKDPVGGYIPPKFEPDVVTSGSKGVLIGKDDKPKLDDQEKEESDTLNTANGGSSSSKDNKEKHTKKQQNGSQNQVSNLKRKENSSGSVKSISDIQVTDVEPLH